MNSLARDHGFRCSPQCIGVGFEVTIISLGASLVSSLLIFFGNVNEVTAEDQCKKSDVQRGNQFLRKRQDPFENTIDTLPVYLSMNVHDTSQQPPRSSVSVDVQNAQDL